MRPVVAPTRKGFFAAFLAFDLPLSVFALVSAALAPAPARLPYFNGSTASLVWSFVAACVLAPLFETPLLTYCTHIARQAIQRHWVACAAGGAPLALLHLTYGWGKVVVVFWSFAWSAHCYLSLTEQNHSFRLRFAFLAGMHALSNAISVSLLAWVVLLRQQAQS